MIRDLDSAMIDEVQLAPDLLRAIKESIDNDRRRGRFLLTGSANILTLPKISESLAGRMKIVTLLPLSRAEVEATSCILAECARRPTCEICRENGWLRSDTVGASARLS
jgi:predicted AAA+ superfamily ATPase